MTTMRGAAIHEGDPEGNPTGVWAFVPDLAPDELDGSVAATLSINEPVRLIEGNYRALRGEWAVECGECMDTGFGYMFDMKLRKWIVGPCYHCGRGTDAQVRSLTAARRELDRGLNDPMPDAPTLEEAARMAMEAIDEALRAEPPTDVVAAVCRRGDRYWICRRNAEGESPHLAGMWEYPGGKVHAGEQLRAAMARELREEFGLEQVELGRVLDTVAYGEFRVTFFEASFEGEPELRHHTEARWATADEVLRLDHLPSGTIFNAKHLQG